METPQSRLANGRLLTAAPLEDAGGPPVPRTPESECSAPEGAEMTSSVQAHRARPEAAGRGRQRREADEHEQAEQDKVVLQAPLPGQGSLIMHKAS